MNISALFVVNFTCTVQPECWTVVLNCGWYCSPGNTWHPLSLPCREGCQWYLGIECSDAAVLQCNRWPPTKISPAKTWALPVFLQPKHSICHRVWPIWAKLCFTDFWSVLRNSEYRFANLQRLFQWQRNECVPKAMFLEWLNHRINLQWQKSGYIQFNAFEYVQLYYLLI